MSDDTTNTSLASPVASDEATASSPPPINPMDAPSDAIGGATTAPALASDGEAGGASTSPESLLPQPQPPRPLAPVEKMEVEVDFEVGRVTLPVSALANIAQGAVVEVGSLSLDRVVAKSGGVAFAHGEFVELGGRVGFRITKLFSERSSP